MAKKLPRTDFSDKAKCARGVTPRDMDAEIEALRAGLMAQAAVYTEGHKRLQDRIHDAIRAFEESRRGDGMAILRALVRRTDGKLSAPPRPLEPGAA
jgi:hypothetical protein